MIVIPLADNSFLPSFSTTPQLIVKHLFLFGQRSMTFLFWSFPVLEIALVFQKQHWYLLKTGLFIYMIQ